VSATSNLKEFKAGALSNLIPLWYLVHRPGEVVKAVVHQATHPAETYQDLNAFSTRVRYNDPYALGQLAGAGIAAWLTPEFKIPDGAEVATVGGRIVINGKYAGKIHPAGVEFTGQGFPKFGPYAVVEVQIEGLSGNYAKDAALANRAAHFDSTPGGFVWHHVEDGKTMQLVPQDIHTEVKHTGGAAVIRNGGVDQK
jgi:hypothetical protein